MQARTIGPFTLSQKTPALLNFQRTEIGIIKPYSPKNWRIVRLQKTMSDWFTISKRSYQSWYLTIPHVRQSLFPTERLASLLAMVLRDYHRPRIIAVSLLRM